MGGKEVLEGELRWAVADAVLNYMIKRGVPLTLKNYLDLAYWGSVKNLEQLGAEDLAEIEALLNSGELGVETADGKVEFRLPVEDEDQ